MSKIKVLHMVNQLDIGGTEKCVQTFAKYHDKERFEVYVCGRLRGGVRAEIIKRYGIEVFIKPPDLSGLMKSLKIDILHIHRAGSEESSPIEAARRASVPVIIETNVFGRVDKSQYNDLIDCHILISYFCARRYQHLISNPLVSEKYKILYNPVDLEPYEEYKFTRDYKEPTIGRLGRRDDAKWDMISINMVPYVLKYFPNLIYYVVGATDSVKRRIRELGIEKNIVFMEPMVEDKELMNFFNKLKVFVHSTCIGESFGLAIAEAMAAKLPVVTHNCWHYLDNAQAEIVDHELTGYVVNSPIEYAAAVINLLGNESLARKMGEKGYEKVRKNFEAKVITRALEEIYLYHFKKKLC
jgi:glycosyltransferase involved in cell wall biosynthesis